LNGSAVDNINWDEDKPEDAFDKRCAIFNDNMKLQNDQCYWKYCFPCQFKKQVPMFFFTTDQGIPIEMDGSVQLTSSVR
jgi:hypothetical protein